MSSAPLPAARVLPSPERSAVRPATARVCARPHLACARLPDGGVCRAAPALAASRQLHGRYCGPRGGAAQGPGGGPRCVGGSHLGAQAGGSPADSPAPALHVPQLPPQNMCMAREASEIEACGALVICWPGPSRRRPSHAPRAPHTPAPQATFIAFASVPPPPGALDGVGPCGGEARMPGGGWAAAGLVARMYVTTEGRIGLDFPGNPSLAHRPAEGGMRWC